MLTSPGYQSVCTVTSKKLSKLLWLAAADLGACDHSALCPGRPNLRQTNPTEALSVWIYLIGADLLHVPVCLQ